ncbi:hypothetical protein P280DRAFT_472692 [Massarina eburnea CBS 473.64]|uniref:RING-type domain-containing protein n=1 Tax=Massarina eburnea CBS 473.64 TaxID=1395130 RepID=A0A6A6RNR1_9PLEO|nr:hypothetical protein P280DRAFT_472692 [Massarina eburnea CBS 473.64]
MTSVFSSLVRPAKAQRVSSHESAAESLDTATRRQSASEADPDLRELNACLQALTEIFPDVQAEVFREMLSAFSAESRLQVVTEQVLKHANKWVRGRYRMPAEQEEQRAIALYQYKYRKVEADKDTRGVPLAVQDKFRSPNYKEAAKEALYQEFKGLSHSTIKAVLAEWNWSYTYARPTLLALASNSWRSSITNFLMRRKTPTAADHPLVMWLAPDPKTGRGRKPLLVKTKSAELDQELYDTLIVPEMEKQQKEQLHQDFELALQWNEEEAEKEGEMYDCECCFIPNTLQQMSACDVEGHYICFRCIRHGINAALYDQGWARNIDTRLCTLKCIAPSTVVDGCQGCIPLSFIRRALLEEKDGEDTLHKLHERFISESMTKSKLPLIQCPFCSYVEVDELALSATNLFAGLRIKRRPLIISSIPIFKLLYFQAARVFLTSLLLTFSLIALVNYTLPQPFPLFAPIKNALRRIHLKRRGLRFQCLSPSCSRASCLTCSAPWHDPHTCYSSQVTSLRLTLERATTDAIKRTCPVCNLGFIKSDGCNKLVCLCGYSMCYVCRQGLKVEGYSHFCQHFRIIPGQQCAECDKCDLYRVENEDNVVERARERAEREWWDSQGEGGDKGLKKEVVLDGKGKGGGWWMRFEGWIESGVEAVVV